MRVLVFGATGRVGAAVVEQARSEGHDVTAFVRDPKRLKTAAKNIAIVVGDVYEPESIVTAIRPGFDCGSDGGRRRSAEGLDARHR